MKLPKISKGVCPQCNDGNLCSYGQQYNNPSEDCNLKDDCEPRWDFDTGYKSGVRNTILSLIHWIEKDDRYSVPIDVLQELLQQEADTVKEIQIETRNEQDTKTAAAVNAEWVKWGIDDCPGHPGVSNKRSLM